MSSTPPNRPSDAVADEAPVEVTPMEARGAMRTGRAIWILVISLAFVTVLLIGFWLTQASHFASINHPQVRDMNRRDISTFNTPVGSAREAPPSPSLDNHQ